MDRTSRERTFGAGSNIVETGLFCKLKIIIRILVFLMQGKRGRENTININ